MTRHHRCPECGRMFLLRKSGNLRKHKNWTEWCPGGGHPPTPPKETTT